MTLDRPLLTYADDDLIAYSTALKSLESHEGWAIFALILKDAVQQARALGFEDTERIVYWKGVVDGLTEAWEIRKQLHAAAAKVQQREDAQDSRKLKRLRASGDDATF